MRKNLMIIFLLMIFFSVFLTASVFADKISLQSGQSYRGELLNDTLKLRTNYAEISLQSSYLSKITRENGTFVLKAAANNRFSGQLLSDLSFSADGEQLNLDSDGLKSLDLSNNQSFNDNKSVSVTVSNGDLFFANLMVESISIQTSLGSPLNIQFRNINSIEYLPGENLYLIRRKQGEDIKANFAQQKLIVWPAAGEIFELDLNYLEKLEIN